MERRPLGSSGIEVSRVILGCGNFGGIGSAPAFFGHGDSKEQAFVLLDAARELGITTLDTADAYGGGASESFIGEWLRSRRVPRDEVELSTKVYNPMGEGLDHGLAPERIRRQLDGSLERLGVDHVDMYLTHAPDPETPLAETLAAMDDLLAAGKVRAVGGANLDGATLRESLGTYRWVQNAYSLIDREAEGEVLPLCAANALGFTPFSPLAGGLLTGKYRRGEPPPPGSRMATRPEMVEHLSEEQIYGTAERLLGVAARFGVDAPTLAFAWLFAQPGVTAVIVGPRRPEHLLPALRALELELGDELVAELDELSTEP
jgi:aryl-alcohol dehydrogenase-like predicted oxidoreductase